MSTNPAPRKCTCISKDWTDHGNNVEVRKGKPKHGASTSRNNASSVDYEFKVEAEVGIKPFILLMDLNVSCPVPDGRDRARHTQRSLASYFGSSSSVESEFTCDDLNKICKRVKDEVDNIRATMNFTKIRSEGKEEFNKRLSRKEVSELVGSGYVINSTTCDVLTYTDKNATSSQKEKAKKATS